MSTIESVAVAALAAKEIVADPYLPEVACQLIQMSRAEKGLPPGPRCARTRVTPYQKRKGVGLRHAVRPLRIAVWARRNPPLAMGVAIGMVGLVYYLGFADGRRKGRKRS